MHEFNVDGMGCASCVGKIQRAIDQLDPDAQVNVDRAQWRVSIVSELTQAQLAEALTAAGFAPRPAQHTTQG